ncbi:MAG: NBR1-Ig-like domain-containing protein [Anaerolineales bacterium]
MNKSFAAPCLLAILVLSACNLSQDNPLPEGKPGALYTEAAMTVSAKLTADGIGKPQSAQTLSPEETVSPAAGSVMPTLTHGEGDESKSEPCDQVKFVKDVTIPDDMNLAPGEKFTKTWRLQNAGSCPWTIGYLLYFESGDSMGAPASQELTSETIQPGDTVDVSVDMIAPQEPGMYQGNWKIRNVKGDGFGVGPYSRAFWVKITIVEEPE